MFAKLKKKIAEEAATAPRSGVRIPRTISKESITSVGADSGDDFASDGSSSRDDLPAQLLRRNYQIRKLEAKLSDYAEQLRIMQKTKEKLEFALENHQDSSIKKLQDQNESHQTNRDKMAEGMALALEKKDQEWMEKMASVEKEKMALSAQLEEMMAQSLTLFQKRDDLDELEGFQQQELAKVKHMLLRKEEQLSQQERELQKKEAEVQSTKRELSEARGKLQHLEQQHKESCTLKSELEIEREELLLLREEADKKISELEGQCQDLQSVIQQVSEDFQKSQSMVSALEKSLHDLQTDQDALRLQQQKAAVTEEDKERLLLDLQKKVTSLERRLHGNLSQDEHLQELIQEKSSLEQTLEGTRAELLAVRTNHADTVSSLEAQVSRMSCSITELQTLLRHKEDSSRAYRERTDTQVANLEQQIIENSERLKSAEHQITEKQQHMDKLEGVWSAEKAFLDQQVCLLQQQSEEKVGRLEESIISLETDKQTLQDRVADLERQKDDMNSTLRQQIEELEQCRLELSSRQTVSTEIAKALEETRRQKEELQTQVGEQATSLQMSQQELSTVTEKLELREEDIKTLQNEVQSRQASQVQLQKEVERVQAQLEQMEVDRDSQLINLRKELLSQTQQLDSCQARILYLEVEVETLTEQLHSPEVSEEDQNGSVTVDDLDHIQKVNKELEQQLSDKNKTIKQLQQRLAELRRTLQKELKLKPEPEAEGKEKLVESRAEKHERVCPEPSSMSALSPPTSNTTVTNTSDLNDSREINFEYLKHVVLKFMSSREAEAFQLIRAVSVLLNFTQDEEDMVKQTLEYKMSWFGSKPSPKGITRPSISGASTPWS
ncbi:golgin subfamily A member 1 isoform X1 [Hippoglossus stenolepis]|uniref:golgin subfamily A member 1 isoform X1 n=1 Tax=Hippoglossus stenolepis TaxID=195615 RepID=UPI00159C161F|nr:golgin subfamily A member 1 isoform X1 [Hippoglossus stenolepis]XP_035022125.1 golgin subfamily A member 1 isoform X1 [Hippoglossus stenolepis]XP_035022126.1 golgin subfamily A member 1 isoform X1 [Hippoglossus stenolepis]